MEGAKRLSAEDIDGMRTAIEDDGMVFNREYLKDFLTTDGNHAFGWTLEGKIVGIAYGYDLKRPDGKHMFYLHSIGFLPDYQNKGRGSKLFQYIVDYAHSRGFSEVFVITDKANSRACKIYEKAGAKSDVKDEIVYVAEF